MQCSVLQSNAAENVLDISSIGSGADSRSTSKLKKKERTPSMITNDALNNGLLRAATRVDNATTAKRTCDKRAGRRRDMSDSWWSIFLRGRQLLVLDSEIPEIAWAVLHPDFPESQRAGISSPLAANV